jgi:hypothetical protein
MKEKRCIKELFENKPIQWGFRGDPEMWDKLKTSFGNIENNFSSIEFENELKNHFHQIIKTEGKMSSNNTVRFENFSQKGMSGGFISIEWWEEIGLPLINVRYKKLNK